MGKFGNKFLAAIGIEEVPVEGSYYEEAEAPGFREPDRKEERKKAAPKGDGKIIKMYDFGTKILIYQPTGFDQAKDIAKQLEQNRQVVLNLDGLEQDTAQRILDFVSGALYSLRGRISKVTQNIFVAVPANADIETNDKGSMQEKPVDWL